MISNKCVEKDGVSLARHSASHARVPGENRNRRTASLSLLIPLLIPLLILLLIQPAGTGKWIKSEIRSGIRSKRRTGRHGARSMSVPG